MRETLPGDPNYPPGVSEADVGGSHPTPRQRVSDASSTDELYRKAFADPAFRAEMDEFWERVAMPSEEEIQRDHQENGVEREYLA